MENPLDSAGRLAKGAGDTIAVAFSSTARFLEHLTGNVTTAAIFAFFLLLTLSIVKSVASSRNPALYVAIARRISFYMIFIYFSLVSLTAIWVYFSTKRICPPPMQCLVSDELVATMNALDTIWSAKWYIAVLLCIYITARVSEGIINRLKSGKPSTATD